MLATDPAVIQKSLTNAVTVDFLDVGKVILLPSDIEPQVLIRTKAYGHTAIISFICILPPQQREIICKSSYGDPSTSIKVDTPTLVYQYDVYWDDGGFLVPHKGYFFKYHADAEGSLAQSLQHITHYFFPHVYYDGYLCYRQTFCSSPRQLYNVFWNSTFTNNWNTTYNHHRYDIGNLFPSHSPHYYNDYQKSQSLILDKENREFIKNYTDFFELPEKPLGIFIAPWNKFANCNINPSNAIHFTHPWWEKRANNKALCGFAFLKGNNYWIWLKDNSFLKLKQEQVQIA